MNKLGKDKIYEGKNEVRHESAGGFIFFDDPIQGLMVPLVKKKDGTYWMPKGHVMEAETPEDAATRELMKENTKPYKNIVAVNKALGDRSENVTVMTSDEDSAVNYIQDSDITKGTYEYNLTTADLIPMTTIDDFVKENKLQKVNYIKMDTEGYERQVLLGAQETIKKFKPVLALSAYHLSGDKQDLPNLVKSIEPEYKYKLSHEYEEIFFFWI